MSRDKVTVDEPLISTDVDSLIRTIAERKRIPLNDLREISKIDKKTMDKWIAVLEDEGYITVEYGIRGTFILWREIDEVPKGEKTFRTEGSKDTQIHPEPAEAVFSEAAKQPTAEERPSLREEPPAEEQAEEGPVVEMPLADDPEPEELLSQYLARKKNESQDDSESIKSNIITRLKGKDDVREASGGDDSPEEPEDAAEAQQMEEEAAEAAAEPEEAAEREQAAEPEQAEEAPKEYAAPRATLRSDKAPSADVRELMNSYVAEINKEKVKIEALKKEREVLYREKFATMEGKMQADIVVLTEKILEKQTKVAELKERVLELPDKVDELSKLQEQMASLRRESRDALQRTKAKATDFLASVEKSKAEVHGKIADIDSLIEAQSGRIRELEKLSVSLDQRSQKIKSALEAAKAEVEELTAAMGTLGADLQQVEAERTQIGGMTEEIKQAVSDRGAELESLEGELEGISRVEQWAQEYVHDYEQKIDGIEQYVEKSDEELAELKEEAESLYMKKYLGELEDITEAYESELGDAAAREQEIDRKISESKARITELVGESQEMIKKLKGEIAENPQKDYGILVARVKAKTARTKNMLTGKEQERAKLAEESKKVRKTLAVARQSGKAPPPAQKAAPKKAGPAKSAPPKKKRK